MIHIVFCRPSQRMKVFVGSATGPRELHDFEANGSAWGDGGSSAPYGHDCQIAPGHYKLTRVERINPPIPSEGAGQIYVADLTGDDYWTLAKNGAAKGISLASWSIGGVVAEVGNLGKYSRSEVMLHGGGSNLGEPACFDPDQPLCRTFGCTRMHNRDLATLMGLLEPIFAARNQYVIYSVIGDSPELPR